MTQPRLWRVLASMLKVGVTSFGGGSAVIPVLEKELVEHRKYLSEQTFTAHTVLANITPGAQPVKIGGLAGAHARGWLTSVLSAFAVAIPGTAATVAVIALFSVLGPQAMTYVEFLAVGITCFVIVLLLNYVRKVLRGASWKVAVALILASFLATGMGPAIDVLGSLFGQTWDVSLPRLSAVQLILAAIVGIAIYSVVTRHNQVPEASLSAVSTGGNIRSGVVFTIIAAGTLLLSWALGAWRYFALVTLSTLTAFGGGPAYIGVADGFFVASDVVDRSEFYGQLVPVANAMPGPVLVKLAAAMGYSSGAAGGGVGLGLVFAAMAAILAVSSCCAVVMFFMAAYDKVSESRFVINLGRFILPVICGLLITTSFSMVRANIGIGRSVGLASPALAWGSILGVALLGALYKRVPDLALLMLGGTASFLALFVITA